MNIPNCLSFENYNKYPNDNNPTTNADIQEYLKNQNDILKSITDALLWQPNTYYSVNQEVHSPDLPAGYMLVCTQAGTTGATQPAWRTGKFGYTDGTVSWRMFSISNDKLSTTGGTLSGNLTIKDYTTNSSDTVTSEQYRELRFRENDDGTSAVLRACHRVDGSKVLSLNAVSETIWATLDIGVDKYGNRFLRFNDEIALNNNGRQIATTKFVKSQGYVTNEQLEAKGYATEGELQSKVDKTDFQEIADYIVERGTSTDGTQWYRKWKSGWLEQGGNVTGATSYDINLEKAYADTNYNVQITLGYISTSTLFSVGATNKETNTFKVNILDGNGTSNRPASWYTCGQGAE